MEWAKAKARADRWEEDVELLDEEMRRVLVFCEWKADWWMKQVPLRRALDAPLAEGLHAYASEQADMERRIHLAWSKEWASARVLAKRITGGSSFITQDAEAGPIRFEIEEDRGGVEGDSDFEE